MPGGLFQTIGTGGPVIMVLLALSLLSLALIGMKILQLWSVRAGAKRRSEALDLWAGGDKHTAKQAMEGGKSPADRVTAYAMAALTSGARRTAVEAEVTRRGNAEVEAMGSHIRLLELIAMISPLLGLLGTVLGMIQSFQELELAQGAANASVLAGGIWQALLTTAAGLIVAIPAAIGATLLSARVDSAGHLIESAVGELYLIEDTGKRN